MKTIIHLFVGAKSVAVFLALTLFLGIGLVRAQSTFTVNILNPTNNESFNAHADILLHAVATDSNIVGFVQFFSNGAFIGGTTNPFSITWTNVSAGSYALTALATDSAGHNATSPPVNITVGNGTNTVGNGTNTPPTPFTVTILYPSNGQTYAAPAYIPLRSSVVDTNAVESVQYFASTNLIGTAQGSPFELTWSNVPAGSYTLTAVATDAQGNKATSGNVNITVDNGTNTVGNGTNQAPTVNIFATDPVAVQGTNCPNVFKPLSVATNYVSGTNTATFLVHRNGGLSGALTVYYSISGTASNGVDYAAIPTFVTIPNNQTYGLVTIVPLGNTNASSCHKTVILTLTSSTNAPPAYIVGMPSSAGAVILGDSLLPITNSMMQNMPDCSLHISLPATNGMNFCLEASTNMVNWVPVCTNTVLKGSAQYVDPRGATSPNLYYRIVPVSAPATY